jgi:nucleotide-binding universal stress UspA family protein
MFGTAAANRIAIDHILFLTDFSESSDAALRAAKIVARGYESHIRALHVQLPPTIEYGSGQLATATMDAMEEACLAGIRKTETALEGIPHDSACARGGDVWPTVERELAERRADLIVVGTHGRTGFQRLLLGSVAEEIFRQSRVPVLTIGLHVATGREGCRQFKRILLATDFQEQSSAAVPYALSFAQEYEAELDLLHVIRTRNEIAEHKGDAMAAAAAMHRLQDLMPGEALAWCRPHSIVRYGDPGAQILQAAEELRSDLIVMGVRGAPHRLGRATHLERAVAHRVVTRATCPVLTVRSPQESRKSLN